MESYFEKGARLKDIYTTLSPHAKEYQPTPVDSKQQPPIKQQQQQHAYRNATQANSQDNQLNDPLLQEKTSSKPLLDPHAANKSKCHSVSTIFSRKL